MLLPTMNQQGTDVAVWNNRLYNVLKICPPVKSCPCRVTTIGVLLMQIAVAISLGYTFATILIFLSSSSSNEKVIMCPRHIVLNICKAILFLKNSNELSLIVYEQHYPTF